MNTHESVRQEAEAQAVEFVVRAKKLELILRRAPVEPDDEGLVEVNEGTDDQHRKLDDFHGW